jgi:hypothetical protein
MDTKSKYLASRAGYQKQSTLLPQTQRKNQEHNTPIFQLTELSTQ